MEAGGCVRADAERRCCCVCGRHAQSSCARCGAYMFCGKDGSCRGTRGGRGCAGPDTCERARRAMAAATSKDQDQEERGGMLDQFHYLRGASLKRKRVEDWSPEQESALRASLPGFDGVFHRDGRPSASVCVRDFLLSTLEPRKPRARTACNRNETAGSEDGFAPTALVGTHLLQRPGPSLYNALALPDDAENSSGFIDKIAQGKAGWKHYLGMRRHLQHQSILPSLFSLPLTIFQAIVQFLERSGSRRGVGPAAVQSVSIDVIGVAEEARQAWVLEELAWLLDLVGSEDPSSAAILGVNMRYVGIELPEDLDGSAVRIVRSAKQKCEIRVSFHRAAYHEIELVPASSPLDCDIVVMPNAGIALYSSWPDTLRLVLSQKNPFVVVTDFTEEAAHYAAEEAKRMLSGRTRLSPFNVQMNPFGERPTAPAPGCLLPMSRNGWLFTICCCL